MDRNLIWETQITEIVNKENKTLGLLCCLMPRIGGSSDCSRRLLGVAVQSRLLYGSSIWSDAMRKKKLRKKYQSVQRKLAIQITERHLFVLARTPSIDLLVQKRNEAEQKKLMEHRYWACCIDQKTNTGPKAVGRQKAWSSELLPHAASDRTWFLPRHTFAGLV
ncbi:hypothetical protein Trydic_g11100 [Trypoxylus dichotomus]